ncbi:uncharacterized protein LACBIDRAFT_302111 [Laccaria bicolor S238N-H82]|uniref:Predicted protein n=1 Tax=Laccaria bicolor (strain S238N-H82 / ATCC MYA-4686) TaxID=486041 RepID=B0DH33_LACBS|nr:uncharacterized protein LACBIDRAFT_302100 [Laccaria bicolor S238N-H82]XP_001883332.1 uncharacterized protein LACBIDRAFT_302111 [Laccaria bicolor S238N-H82]EDR06042.1 predicted protein [Laccaria bicolor S238N-H82]EDR06044.1 predicted protein [Laccaria bicolor S238N-H82]|eukprot:XP_001883330.1 predicted protein [Laccaria bicolor S238N-H82]
MIGQELCILQKSQSASKGRRWALRGNFRAPVAQNDHLQPRNGNELYPASLKRR